MVQLVQNSDATSGSGSAAHQAMSLAKAAQALAELSAHIGEWNRQLEQELHDLKERREQGNRQREQELHDLEERWKQGNRQLEQEFHDLNERWNRRITELKENVSHLMAQVGNMDQCAGSNRDKDAHQQSKRRDHSDDAAHCSQDLYPGMPEMLHTVPALLQQNDFPEVWKQIIGTELLMQPTIWARDGLPWVRFALAPVPGRCSVLPS